MDAALRTSALTPPRLARTAPSWWLSTANSAALVLCLVILYAAAPVGSTMHVGEVAGTTIVAPRQVTYIDRVATAAKRRLAAAAVTPAYQTDTAIAGQRLDQARAFLASAAPILASKAAPAHKLNVIRNLLPSTIPALALQQFASLTANDFKIVQVHSLALLSQAVAWRFDSNQITSTEFGLLSSVPGTVTPVQRTSIGEVLATFLAPTLVPDPTRTAIRQQRAKDAVPDVVATIYAGQVVVRNGDIVTPTVMEKLDALGLQGSQHGWQRTAASLLFSLIIVAMLLWYLRAFHPSVIMHPRLLLLIDASVLGAVAGARLLTTGHVLLPFFLPVAAASTFAAVLMAPEACIAVAFAMAVLAGWVVANSFELTMYFFLSSAAGVLAIRQVRQVKQFVLAGLYISLFALLTLLAFGLLDKTYDLAAIQEYLLVAAFNGLVSSTLALGGFALLSGFFGVTTSLQLLELGQPNQPLLRRLMVKAPGTYNHSLILASMVEHAAQEIGADALVAKIGALYHDIGKSTNPHCYVENQMGMANIHDDLAPEESARIIRGHVSQGVRLARQHRLPSVILQAIREHHGTMTIAYFLRKAIEDRDDIPIDESIFAYGGPKPQSKETALLMLADGCESSVRSCPDHSRNTIESMVDRMFAERIESGQLAESPLTLHDLEVARGAFCSVLFGLYHPRIEYPEPAEPALPAPIG
jgi:putative nucleotidyltransferase with HDIG domain